MIDYKKMFYELGTDLKAILEKIEEYRDHTLDDDMPNMEIDIEQQIDDLEIELRKLLRGEK